MANLGVRAIECCPQFDMVGLFDFCKLEINPRFFGDTYTSSFNGSFLPLLSFLSGLF